MYFLSVFIRVLRLPVGRQVVKKLLSEKHSGLGKKPSLIHFVLFCPAKKQFLHFKLPVKQESQEVIYPKAWEGEQILLYSFIQKGKRFTVTRYVGSIRHIRHVDSNGFMKSVGARHPVVPVGAPRRP